VAEISPNQLFTWHRLAEQGALTATQAEEEAVPASAIDGIRICAIILRDHTPSIHYR